MTGMSPLLQNKLNNTNSSNSTVQTKSRVKPNEAKAKIVNENVLQSAVSAVRDTGKDCVNFVNILKTGKTSDHNLGRLNDLGLKAGALLIASFLAVNAKTKTKAIKHFIGGATFLASMTLWPKIFINLPARLVHGFRIDKKYISSQGDKKDFGLDNQYYVWDAVPEKDLRKAAKKTGIDYDGKDGKEKTQRKIQKTILQNRTLNMATVGFATPLMTALFGNAIDPYVKKAVINNEFQKVKNILGKDGNIDECLLNLKASKEDIKNVKEIDKLFKEYASKAYDDSFFKKLASYLELNVVGDFKNPDFVKPIQNARSFGLEEALKDIYRQGELDTSNLKELLLNEETFKLGQKKPIAQNYKDLIDSIKGMQNPDDIKELIGKQGFAKEISEAIESCKDAKEIKDLLSQKGFESFVDDVVTSAANVAKPDDIKEILKSKGYLSKRVDTIVSQLSLKERSKEDFQKLITDYNKNIVSTTRTKLKSYLKLMTPVVGEAEESVYTSSYTKTMDDIIKQLNLPYTTKQDSRLAKIAKKLHIPYKPKNDVDASMTLKGFKDKSDEKVMNALHKIFSSKVKDVEYGSDGYKNLVKTLYSKPIDDDVKEVVAKLSDANLLDAIRPKDGNKALNEALLGGKGEGNVIDLLSNFIKNANLNIDAVKTRAVICANFEARFKNIEEAFREIAKNGNVVDENIFNQLMGAAKEIVYNDSMTYRKVGLNMANKELFPKVMEVVFDEKQFNAEEEIIPGIKNIIKDLNQMQLNTSAKDSKKIVGMVGLLTNRAKEVFNNKTWVRTFAPLAAGLVAITLLVQPLFGKIDNEFGEESIKGGTK